MNRRGSQAILLARRAPTIKRWSLDARSKGQPGCPFCEVASGSTDAAITESLTEGRSEEKTTNKFRGSIVARWDTNQAALTRKDDERVWKEHRSSQSGGRWHGLCARRGRRIRGEEGQPYWSCAPGGRASESAPSTAAVGPAGVSFLGEQEHQQALREHFAVLDAAQWRPHQPLR